MKVELKGLAVNAGSKAANLAATGTNSVVLDGVNNSAANATASVVLGQNNIANAANQTIVGKYNEQIDNALFIVGNGNETLRENILAVKEDGSTDLTGQLNVDNIEISNNLNVGASITASGENHQLGKFEVTEGCLVLNDKVDSTKQAIMNYERFAFLANTENTFLTAANIENSYYTKSNTYSKTEIDNLIIGAMEASY